MALLDARRDDVKSPDVRSHNSPFYSRAYGGYTPGQLEFAFSERSLAAGGVVLDPMAGQAYALSQRTWRGETLCAGDLNPAALFLAALRDPALLLQSEKLADWLAAEFRRLTRSAPTEELDYSEKWLSDGVSNQLSCYSSALGLTAESAPGVPDALFWEASPQLRLAAAIPVLAARRIATFTRTDNTTWLRSGGLQRVSNVYEPLTVALQEWREFAAAARSNLPTAELSQGKLRISVMDAERGFFATAPEPDVIVTSPPYANRLDYTRLWGPELAVAAAMFRAIDVQSLQARQIGSNVVRGKHVDAESLERLLDPLPPMVRNSLLQIRDEPTPSSGTYYFPFFTNYAVALSNALRNLAALLRPGGALIIFVRDTVAKDVLFPTAELVQGVLAFSGLAKTQEQQRIIRSHIGLRRRNARAGLYGIAQREWWFAFRKEA